MKGTEMKLEAMSQRDILIMKLVLSAHLMIHAVVAGIQIYITGPVLPDLRRLYGSTVEEISRSLAFKNIGYMFGALFGGVTCDKLQSYTLLWLIVSEVIMAASALLTPFGNSLPVLGVFCFLQGLGHGFGTPVYVSTTTTLWGKKSAMPMHCIMFGFPLGTVFAPLIASPFLSERESILCQGSNSTSLTGCLNTTHEFLPQNATSETWLMDEGIKRSMIFIYGIISLLTFSVAVVGVILYFLIPKDIFTTTKKAKKSFREIFSPGSCSGGASTYGAILVAFFCVFVTCMIAIARMNGLMYSFLIESDLQFSKSEAVLLMFSINLAGMGGRAFTTIVSHFCPIQPILAVEVFGNLLASAGMAFLGVNNGTMLWVFALLGNAFNGPMFPAQYSWLDRYIVLYSTVVSLSNISMSGSGYLFDWLNGYFYTNFYPATILYSRLGFSGILALLYVIMQLIASSHGERERRQEKTEAVDEKEVLKTLLANSNKDHTNGKAQKTDSA